ncbi:MAG: hypothetical protein ACJA0H_000960 [Francisellaceae bacterium]
MDFIYQLIVNTPLWVYAILAYIIFVGYKASKPGTITLGKQVIILIIFSYLGVSSFFSSFQLDIFNIGLWCISILIGAAYGWFWIKTLKLKVKRSSKMFYSEGSWRLMYLLIIIFISNYYIGYQTAINQDMFNQLWFDLLVLFISGACLGIIIGRFICYLYRLKHDISIETEE